MALAHLAGSAETHLEQDSVLHTARDERRLEHRTGAATASDVAAAANDAGDDPGELGEWGPVVDWPVVGIHVALLENGKVLAFDSVGDEPAEAYPDHDFTRATVWDPITGVHTVVDVTTGHNIFCSGFAHLADGTLFVAGGNASALLDGIAQTHLFDSSTNEWSLGADMAHERWYPSVTPLSSGEMLITEGGPDIPEVRKLDGGMRALTTATQDLPLYPWIDVGPDGRALYSGPDATLRSLDPTGTGSWQALGPRDDIDRDFGGHAMFDIGRVLVAGGGNSTPTATVIDLNQGEDPVSSPTSPMEHGRRQNNLTVLADGTVLATGGNSSGGFHVDLDNGVYEPELWSPDTGRWRSLAPMAVTRQYHSTALLLPDGRVLSSGGGICKDCDAAGYLAKNAELFSPPYLFERDGSGALAPRPEITAAPPSTGYDQTFTIATGEPGSIDEVAMIRLGSVTHSVNMEQRFVPLSFTPASEVIRAVSPAGPGVAPPGVYMLVVIDEEGVPSVARMIEVGGPAPNPPQREPEPAAETDPPETRIDAGPAKRTRDRRVRFHFFADEPDATFECRRDGRPFVPCASPKRFDVARGRHTFEVRATDASGNVDPAAARWRFRVLARRGGAVTQ